MTIYKEICSRQSRVINMIPVNKRRLRRSQEAFKTLINQFPDNPHISVVLESIQEDINYYDAVDELLQELQAQLLQDGGMQDPMMAGSMAKGVPNMAEA